MILRTALVTAALLAVTTIPTAHADPDGQYLAALAALGIDTTNAPALISAGHTVCDSVGNPFQALAANNQYLVAGVSHGQLRAAEVAGARAYCPDLLRNAGLS